MDPVICKDKSFLTLTSSEITSIKKFNLEKKPIHKFNKLSLIASICKLQSTMSYLPWYPLEQSSGPVAHVSQTSVCNVQFS